MTTKSRLPWYLKRAPEVTKIANVEVDIDDHFGHEILNVTEWPNGEGLELSIVPDKGPEIHTPLTWQEWDALQRAVRALKAATKH